jgi:hypothetical protein
MCAPIDGKHLLIFEQRGEHPCRVGRCARRSQGRIGEPPRAAWRVWSRCVELERISGGQGRVREVK